MGKLAFEGHNAFLVLTTNEHGEIVQCRKRNSRDAYTFARGLAETEPGVEVAVYERRAVFTGRITVDVDEPRVDGRPSDASGE